MSGTDPMILVAAGAMTLLAVGLFVANARSGGGGNVDSLISQAMMHKQRNELVEAELKLEKALTEMEGMRKVDLDKMASCLVSLGEVYERQGKPEKSGAALQRCLKQWKEQLARNALTTVDIDYAVSNMDFGRATYDLAEFYIDNVVTLREKTLPAGHPDILTSHLLGAQLLRKAGYKEEADILEARSRKN